MVILAQMNRFSGYTNAHIHDTASKLDNRTTEVGRISNKNINIAERAQTSFILENIA